jgi:glycosyltransferase involved in cell wall biosynthesis
MARAWTTRTTALTARLGRAPSAGRRRFAELVRRDDVAHQLLESLHARMNELEVRLKQIQEDQGALREEQSRLYDATTSRAAALAERVDALSVVAPGIDDVRSDLAALALTLADSSVPDTTGQLLVSVVLPTYQRAAWVPAAVRSVLAQTYARWELVVVDDGSDDGTVEALAPFLDDDRITLLQLPHAGAAGARNRGLEATVGELVAYLDSDNVWHPTHLARHVHALEADPQAVWSVGAQIVNDGTSGQAHLRRDLRSTAALIDENHIDLNALVHRRSVLDDIGSFDETLRRLIDWDFILRLARSSEPIPVRSSTSIYRIDAADRISWTEPAHVTAHRIRARHRGLPADGLRVLFVEWHFPQITETYIAALAHGLVDIGADVHVWALDEPSVDAGTDLVVHRGRLEDAIAEFAPQLVLTHWLQKGRQYRPESRAAGLPHAIRVHGFDYDASLVGELLGDDGVFVHTFPHLVAPEWAGHPRLAVSTTAFDDRRWRPVDDKDPLLVVRTVAGLLTKDLDTFLHAARMCPHHRFVLVVGHSLSVEERTEQLIERAAELDSPCEVLVDLSHDDVTELVGRAGIYLHTHGTDHPVTMPISIAEAMATGCWVLARDLPGLDAYVQPAGALYDGDTPEQRAARAALLIDGSRSWSAEQWAAASRAATEQAFARYAGSDVAAHMVRDWAGAFPQVRAALTSLR